MASRTSCNRTAVHHWSHDHHHWSVITSHQASHITGRWRGGRRSRTCRCRRLSRVRPARRQWRRREVVARHGALTVAPRRHQPARGALRRAEGRAGASVRFNGSRGRLPDCFTGFSDAGFSSARRRATPRRPGRAGTSSAAGRWAPWGWRWPGWRSPVGRGGEVRHSHDRRGGQTLRGRGSSGKAKKR